MPTRKRHLETEVMRKQENSRIKQQKIIQDPITEVFGMEVLIYPKTYQAKNR